MHSLERDLAGVHAQIILKLVFGLGPDRLTPELLERCHAAFITFDEHLFSFPIDLPGFGMLTSHKSNLLKCIKDCIEPLLPTMVNADSYSITSPVLQVFMKG